MEIVITNDKNTANVCVSGRLDTLTAPELESKISDVISSFNSVVFDFAGLDYLSSAGLRVILSTQKALAAKSGDLTIKNVNDSIMDVFNMTGFTSILHIE